MRQPAAKIPAQSLPKCAKPNGLTRDEIESILTIHNTIRAELNLAALSWDCMLADLAQDWARRGMAAHHDDTTFGESIFVASAANARALAAVDRWMLEKPAWNNRSGACAPGKVCTHYTQIVWKRTARIGCGINRNVSGKWKTILVCNYDPAGNSTGPAY